MLYELWPLSSLSLGSWPWSWSWSWPVAMVVRGGDRGHGDGRCDSGGSDSAMTG